MRHTSWMESVTCLLLVASLVAAPGCDSGDALGLEDYQRDLLGGLAFAILGGGQVGLAGPAGERGPEGPTGPPGPAGTDAGQPRPGEPGEPGLSCWDLNGDGIADPEEDVNDDGVFNVLDCQGPAGPGGAQGSPGSPGADGTDGEPGPEFFDVFVDDFFVFSPGDFFSEGGYPAAGEPENAFPLISVDPGSGISRAAYRVAIPPIYDGENPVTMRLFLFRDGKISWADCFVFALDARRARDEADVEVYGGTRWIRVDLPAVGTPAPEDDLVLVIDLPLNVGSAADPTGLGFPNDLTRGEFLAFELTTAEIPTPCYDGGEYYLLGVEFFESAADADPPAAVDGATIFFSKPANCCGEE